MRVNDHKFPFVHWHCKQRENTNTTSTCNATLQHSRIANSNQQGNGWTSNNKKTPRQQQQQQMNAFFLKFIVCFFFFQGTCAYTKILCMRCVHFFYCIYEECLSMLHRHVDRTEWLEPLWHYCSSHTIISMSQHHLFSSANINLYARAKTEIKWNGIKYTHISK